ncbi:hypothetical protein UA08_02374 [Talaromyces atroroseus]|uniref:Oleate hydratase n=1 Tax=Talaromyces atroroseus TaxID=1441469 RepID=A0A225AM06_TALAT|nr:hypothetical protein UA08_02374 [Talaromyces atroroseus]OKL62592.1 hypothetical protein UA08_02374 [Talaromyces atroroseus]
MTRRSQPLQSPARRAPTEVNAWILGSSIASLASAVHLICDAKVPASQIHIFESHSVAGDGMISTGNPVAGYDYRAGCMPTFSDSSMRRLLALVPSTTSSNKSLLEDIERFNVEKASQESPTTLVLTRGNYRLEILETKKFGVKLKDRIDLVSLMLKTEKCLGRKRIEELFDKRFFNNYCNTDEGNNRFSFQPWHSAAEFRRCLRGYLSDFRSLNTKKILDCTRYNNYESIVVPIVQFLQNQGVDFRFCHRVTDIETHSASGVESVSAIHTVQNGLEGVIKVCPTDLVIVSIGSITSGSSSGTNRSSPPPSSMEPEIALDENWSLWLNLGTKNPKFGNPYNFCTHARGSRLETFTVTLKGAEFFDRFFQLTDNRLGLGTLVSFKRSHWMISLCIPHQPFFSDQPNDVHVFWGYSLLPSHEGNFVKKPMILCSGEEIMTELLWHLDFPMEPILNNSITVPCVMPRMSASLLPRTITDRPSVIPENMTNLALVGQFVEIEDATAVSMDYGVRGVQVALNRLMCIEGPPVIRRGLHAAFSPFWR